MLAVWLVAAQPGWGQASDCSSCHEQSKKIQGTVHEALGCASCHEKHEVYPHPQGIPKPTCESCHRSEAVDYAQGVHGLAARRGEQAAPGCAACHGDAHEMARARTEAFRRSVPETCGMCHSEIQEQFKASVHGTAIARGVTAAPVCTDCHGEHNVIPHLSAASPVSPLHIRETCGRCHGDLRLARRFGLPADRVTSFDTSFHGLAQRAGAQTVANCASCHGVHNILPSSDPKATTHPANLPATCGKCHPGAGSRFAIGQIHFVEGAGEPAPVRWARIFYLGVIPITIGLMLLHHGGDWLRKLYHTRLALRPAGHVPPPPVMGRPELRMYRFERIEHGLLALSFFVLAWTGFALKYPDQWWSRPLSAWESQWQLRGIIHRAAGAVMIAVSLAHVVSLVVNRRLRRHWFELFPRKQDLYDGFQGLAYAVGLTSKPRAASHGYVEKIEYWAVIWGTAVMAATGVMLWANNFFLTWAPKVWLDFASTVHFYEAVLATLSILTWHFYTVIFDPEVYPMDPAWLTGVSVRRREHHDGSAADLAAAAAEAPTSPSPAREEEEHGHG